ncbi:hypothetical protein BJ165DRAFT_1050681 [Panaeolus papilionaceus]|nr:hypothetical protein BJ165DRAFT_1050681 [Panaeolus papilionaceus]
MTNERSPFVGIFCVHRFRHHDLLVANCIPPVSTLEIHAHGPMLLQIINVSFAVLRDISCVTPTLQTSAPLPILASYDLLVPTHHPSHLVIFSLLVLSILVRPQKVTLGDLRNHDYDSNMCRHESRCRWLTGHEVSYTYHRDAFWWIFGHVTYERG